MKLDHATVVTPDLETVKHFSCDIVGLTDGERQLFVAPTPGVMIEFVTTGVEAESASR